MPTVLIHSRWTRPDYDPSNGPYNGYTVLMITNLARQHKDHPPQVVYQGDNNNNNLIRLLPLSEWSWKLILEGEIDA